MQQQLIDHSSDLKRLVDAGFNLEISGGHILAHQIPYLNATRQVKYGTLVCPLSLATPTMTSRPGNHTMHFCGETPHTPEGVPLNAIIIQSGSTPIVGEIVAQHLFSSKPTCGFYVDFYEKFWTYSQVLLTTALAVDPSVTSRPFKKLSNG